MRTAISIAKQLRPPSRGAPAVIAVVVVLAFVALPVLAILVRVVVTGDLLAALGRPIVVDALRLSAFTTTASVALALLLGTPVAYLLARRRFRGQAVVETFLELPLVLPPAVAGVGLLMAFGRKGILGEPLSSFGVTVAFTTAAVILTELFVAGPFYMRAARAGFLSVNPELETVSRTLGVSDWATFWRVTIPVAFPSLLGGAVMCWARALAEFGATIMFAGSFQGRTQTMPLAIYAALESDLDAALALSAILIVISFGVLIGLRLGVGRFGGAYG